MAALNTLAAALPELTVSSFLGAWRPDGVALAAVVLLGGLYAAGVLRRRRAGGRWPAARTAAFAVLGLGAIVVATMSGLAVYGRVLFWPAAVQNIVLDLIAPLGLALGDPLALVAPDGPLHRALTGRVVRLLTYPLVSSAAVLGSELTIYFTPYFETALHQDAVRQLMHLQLLLTGCLFVLPMLTRQELLPRWCTHPVRAALVFLDGLFDSVPGIVVMTSGTLVAGHWYAAHPRTWGPDPRQDQMIGGGLMLTLAELVGLPFLIAVFAQWWRTDRAKNAELDARLDRELLAADPAPQPASAGASAPAASVPEMTRPWWETDAGEVGERMRRRR
ncbi:cytochrome c oxidase assembly protein [Streptomyces sp. H10-C2]|uniref:cytochrome c oxidase assembly protein n=1 Tax=unclassified Streptomyces TaxID=2593676 RepID=UPI0024B95139|nr:MULTISPECIES: cytochrome c oxidase assembly protein [unclassified Streptomyces]MDJ0346922.1 cytochrome c oxidase assembly protein [Streptomyces sp. PH10-H1]MDJ0375253.1 cytochrome c oxidase assembly protein [Streptomyces sp. H10-C2]